MPKWVLLLLSCIVPLVLFVTSVGCGSSGYRKVVVSKGVAHFSFEYSTFYREREGPTIEEGLTQTRLLAPKKLSGPANINPFDSSANNTRVEYVPATIGIAIYDARFRGGTAKGDLDTFLSRIAKDISIVERSTVAVSGVPAEQVLFARKPLLSLPSSNGTNNSVQYNIWTYFDHAGLVWKIEAEYESSLAQRVESDYHHVVETFKILE